MSAADLQQTRLGQLRKLGAVLAPLDQPATQAIHRQFMESFVDPLRHDELLWALSKRRPIDHHRFLRADIVWPSVPSGASIAWLTAGSPGAGCFRLEREPWLPGVRLQPASLDEVWVGSWPGVFVCFEAGRAVLVTLDYERIFCNLRGRSPYR